MDEFRIFLSAVTGEFGKARDAIAADLRARQALVCVQSDFRQEADSDTTLQKLHDYIRDCHAVVCVIGKRSGALPPPAEAAPFTPMLPAGIATASYTQWEFFFARHFRRRLSIYIAKDDYQPDTPEQGGDDAALQQAFLRHILQLGLDRDYFSNVDQLSRAVLKEDWPKLRQPMDSNLPGIGNLRAARSLILVISVCLIIGITAAWMWTHRAREVASATTDSAIQSPCSPRIDRTQGPVTLNFNDGCNVGTSSEKPAPDAR